MRLPAFPLAVAGLFLGLQQAHPAELPDWTQCDRAPLKEPAYVSKRPLYGRAAFGPQGEKIVWLVLDTSKPKGTRYDVLYVDRHADGDLTGAGKRLTAGADGSFRLAEFTDPATGTRHRDFTLRADGEDPTVMLGVQWRGKFRLGGGYPEEPEPGYMHFSPRPADAPVVWVYGDGPFRFQRWYGGRLPIGEAEEFRVFLGQPGRGRSAFCSTLGHILPEGGWVRATLVYRNGMGKERRLVCELRERC
jgi:hypothetical protein